MKNIPFILLIIVILFSCCKSDDELVVTPVDGSIVCDTIDCSIAGDFYGIGLANGECWQADFAVLDPTTPFALSITLGKGETNGISEGLSLIVNNKTDLSDTIWLGWTDFVNIIPNVGSASYYYQEDHSSVGEFDFGLDPIDPTFKDFLLIDYLNEDSSIVEGRFQIRFPIRSIAGFVTHAPDSMQIQCGHFRAMNF